jgi:hypothetical protein
MAMTGNRNYRWFGLACAGLGATLLTVCGDSKPCVPSKCTSGALLQVPIAASAASLVGTMVTVCRNTTECYMATLPDVPAAGSGGTGVYFKEATSLQGTLWQAASALIELDLEWQLDSTQLQDGDHYVVTLTSAAGMTTTMLDKTAVYAPVAPAPDQCTGGMTCSSADLTP